MLDFSFAEIALIVVVTVVFIGPKELPVVLRAVTKAMKQVKALGREVTSAFDELTRETGINEAKNDIEREIKMIRGDDGEYYESYDLSKLAPKTTKEPAAPETGHGG